MAYCRRCGNLLNEGASFCRGCGAPLVQPVKNEGELSKKEIKKRKKAIKKKHKLNGFVKFLIVVAIAAAILLLAWFSIGNQITLTIHSDTVVETLNAGSLELSGLENPYAQLPDYIKNMLDNDKLMEQHGPVTKAVLPYIRAERVKVYGFFNSASVEYKIFAPDLESWLLNYDIKKTTTPEKMLKEIEEYVKNAPLREETVVVEYYRPSFFSVNWVGNYKTQEFANAICGGMNSAYNAYYEKALEELEAMFE